MCESQNSNHSTSKGKEIILPNLGSNDSNLQAVAGMIDHANYEDSSLLERPGMVTVKEINSGFLNSNPTLNANPVETIEVEAKSNTLVSTLATPTHEEGGAAKKY